MRQFRVSDQRVRRPGTVEARRRRRMRPAVMVLEDRRLLLTWTVNSAGDSDSGTGLAGDLRYCIDGANATGGDQTIAFDPTLFGTPQTVTLNPALGQLELSDPSGTEAIEGPAGGVTVSGGGASRVFQVVGGVTASLSGLTITGGNAGAYAVGSALLNYGTATLTDCTISGNSGFSAVSSNGSITVINCTVGGNSSEIGLASVPGPTTMTNTILADPSLIYLGPVSGSNNLIVAGGLVEFTNGMDNIVGVSDPGLAPLGLYGGTALTMPLLPGSPAIDAGTDAPASPPPTSAGWAASAASTSAPSRARASR